MPPVVPDPRATPASRRSWRYPSFQYRVCPNNCACILAEPLRYVFGVLAAVGAETAPSVHQRFRSPAGGPMEAIRQFSVVVSNNLGRPSSANSLCTRNRRSKLPVLVFQTRRFSSRARPRRSSGNSAEARPQACLALAPSLKKISARGKRRSNSGKASSKDNSDSRQIRAW